ncbi:hypothetical protein WR25_18475 [Diploscapter pachys]|uniref:Uncharacterized protein n=1 Tax=Diploscapter pachys TaxID=2018661 RepID=A0A2A2KNA1_9BILA|nr:hypothetical protein WR25_18475 [Diploscapter pachys]
MAQKMIMVLLLLVAVGIMVSVVDAESVMPCLYFTSLWTTMQIQCVSLQKLLPNRPSCTVSRLLIQRGHVLTNGDEKNDC